MKSVFCFLFLNWKTIGCLGTPTRISFEKEKTKFVFMPCRTGNCIPVLHSLNFHRLKDQNFSLFSTFQMFFICTLFSYNNFENSWKCYFKIPWSMLNFCIFSKIKYKPCGWAINLGDKYQSFLISIFLLSLPVMKVRPRNFGSSHQIYCRRRSWAMEVIATVGIKF